MKSLTRLTDLTTDEISSLLDQVDELRARWIAGSMPQSLVRKPFVHWFSGNSFRNRLAFELGARSMGADVSYVPSELGAPAPVEGVDLMCVVE